MNGSSRTLFRALFVPVLLLLLLLGRPTHAKFPGNLQYLEYEVYPKRTQEEAAILEWGHSAIISALDASVAHFGPQTSDAALLEVETHPVLANPLNGIFNKSDQPSNNNIRPLYNQDEVHGNMVVMTNTGELSGLRMAKIAKASGAAALLVVNVDEDRPDDIYRLPVDEDGADKIDIPVAMISLNSANVLTTANLPEDGSLPEQINGINDGMPERVRLYAGSDRPFFEDIEPSDPTIYLIHNLLSSAECDALIKRAAPKVEPVVESDILQLSVDVERYVNVQRVLLWKGLLHTPGSKQIEERIEQVTGFPSAHYSDFVVDRLEAGSYWEPHYDTHPNQIPMATITVFLTEQGGAIIYPSGKEKPLKVMPQKGLAVVHHNLNERHEPDRFSRHAMLPPESGPVYVARKYIFATQVTYARRVALPLVAFAFGGKLPKWIVKGHDWLIYRYGLADGAQYFDKLCLLFPALVLLGLVQIIATAVRNYMSKRAGAAATETTKDASNNKAKESSAKSKEKKEEVKQKEKETGKKEKEAGKPKEKENGTTKEKENGKSAETKCDTKKKSSTSTKTSTKESDSKENKKGNKKDDLKVEFTLKAEDLKQAEKTTTTTKAKANGKNGKSKKSSK